MAQPGPLAIRIGRWNGRGRLTHRDRCRGEHSPLAATVGTLGDMRLDTCELGGPKGSVELGNEKVGDVAAAVHFDIVGGLPATGGVRTAVIAVPTMSPTGVHPDPFGPVFIITADLRPHPASARVIGRDPADRYPHASPNVVPISGWRAIIVAYDDYRRRTDLGAWPTVVAIEVRANNDTADKAADGGGNLVAPVARANR